MMESIFAQFSPSIFRQLGVATWISVGGAVPAYVREGLDEVGIPIRATYSSEEVGPIGFECPTNPGVYHCAHSNVVVEAAAPFFETPAGRVGKILVTHLHSYATPFIRYDLGDLGTVRESCACGHRGTVVSHLEGRESGVLKHRDGRVSPFYVRGDGLAEVGQFSEYRMRQTDFEHIVLELAGRESLTDAERAAFAAFLQDRAGSNFTIDVRPVREIDWGTARKRHAFRSEVR
jgi:phenylacetate-CoA ligase